MRKNLAKLVEHINMLNLHCTENSPEYKLLDNLLTDNMIEIGLSMKLRTPYSIEDIAKKTERSIENVSELIEEMALIGLIEYTSINGEAGVMLPVFAPGSMELMVMNQEQVETHPEIANSFVEYVEGLTKGFASFFPQGAGLLITVPVQKAIDAEPRRIGIEEVSYWVEKYAPSLSVTGCQCRRSARIRGEIGEDLEGEWCIQLGEFAESCIKTNRSRRVTREETYEILKRAEELGYVHAVTNIDGPKKSLFICNCHPECCLGFRTARLVDTPNMMRSNFVATVDKDKCVACGQCMEVCPMNAAKLGQKICQENPVKIKENISPDDHIWSKDKWTLDYRINKKNVVPETGTSPCKTGCPAHISVQAYLKLASQGRYAEALELIKTENPFPAVCGRICNRRCESACTRCTLDEPVAVDEVKKFIAQQELNSATRYVPKKKFNVGKKIAVIGAGPAGLSCAFYLAIYGHQVTVFEKQNQLGGMLKYGIPAFRLEKNVVDAEIEVLKELGIEFKTGIEVGKDITLDELRAHGYKGFYLAIGAQAGRKLGIEGEEAEGVISGIDLLLDVNLGKIDKLVGRTVVVGGGNVAVDVARTAIREGSSSVSLFCLESRDIMPAATDEIEEAEEEGITINNSWGPKRIVTENGKAVGIEFKKCTRVFDEEDRFNPAYNENDTVIVECENVVLTVGQAIQWGGLLNGTKVELNRNQTAKADAFTYQTAQEDSFVGGDAYTGPKFAIDAIAAGKQGAVSLHRYVWEGHDLLIGRDRREYHEIDKNNLRIADYDQTQRQKPMRKADAKLTFSDDRETFTEEQVKKETERCLNCGAAHIDQTRCLGCGLCTTRCKFDAISLSKVSSKYGCTYEQLPMRIAGNVIARTGRIAVRAVRDMFSEN
jgi:NADPH-dependent glutamate synthase beta subunit-like oxidoreductase/NAD-dependent dihydropyrimidine dehydrogenase PreA subunit